eukprot:6211944-Pleurochrysis_carterae.AAC.8
MLALLCLHACSTLLACLLYFAAQRQKYLAEMPTHSTRWLSPAFAFRRATISRCVSRQRSGSLRQQATARCDRAGSPSPLAHAHARARVLFGGAHALRR